MRLVEEIKGLRIDNAEIVVINDGSTDSTERILEDAGISHLSLCINLGYGAAIQTGVKYALENNFEYVVLIDADGQHRATDIYKLLDTVKGGSADLALGSRFIIDTGYKGNILRRIGGVIFSNLVYLLSGIKINDPTSGFQAFNRKTQLIYANDLFPVDYPDADMLLLSIYHNIRIKEIPVEMKVNLKKSMHSGLNKAVYYIYKMLLSILVVASFRKVIKKKIQEVGPWTYA